MLDLALELKKKNCPETERNGIQERKVRLKALMKDF